MSPGQKKLTDPPTHLKEAIDLVISSKGNTQNLAAALEALLKEDADGVAWEVRDVFDVIKNNIIEQFDKMNGPFCDHYKGHLRSATTGLGTAERPVDVKSDDIKTAIEALVKGLKSFLGYSGSTNFNGNGIIASNGGSYTFTYNNAEWDPADAPKCAAIFLGILPAIFFGVTLMYWKCSNNMWKNVYTPPKYFLKQMGYKDGELNQYKKGSYIITYLSGFTELETAKAESNDYPKFLKALQDKALGSTPSTTSPLTSLYLLSYHYITYPLHKVQSSSPATPSFLGYSGPAALAGGAYGFNLGGLGTFMSALLA
ncbi:variant erythrocyte surface antigen-1 family protein [Babesia caballi]|uniref:Variant erythrocyte surface antigen-1 family protein n=1 Tax=Babesia caballi TaxID=5871 RepID=A0AAV4LRW1_BABCB|nr:variant erythrocyte surface antigen-1 family protein [Babesia caballi]